MSEVIVEKEYLLFIENERENEKHWSVGLTYDGKIECGLDYKPDEAAKIFWESMGNQCKLMSKHYKTEAFKEAIEIIKKAFEENWVVQDTLDVLEKLKEEL